MKIDFRIPTWFQDPERLWQRISAGLAIVLVILLVLCVHLQTEKSKYQDNFQKLSELNDRQRDIISQIGSELGQVSIKLDKIAEDQKNQSQTIASISAQETEGEPVVHLLDADLNGDGIVDWSDFEIFSNYWETTGPSTADLNKDDKVDWQDFQLFAIQWMKTEPWYAGNENITQNQPYATLEPVR
ncbi:MAG: dockerin type I domain-containing protein [Phycisphaerae bacterium]